VRVVVVHHVEESPPAPATMHRSIPIHGHGLMDEFEYV
jgi:hypothetical protein